MLRKTGPLAGVKIVEMTGIGPAPYAAMLLADLGAEVIRIDRPGGYPAPDPRLDFSSMGATAVFYRSRPSLRVDLKSKAGRGLLRDLISRSDALIEGYRPGAMEKLGLGPDEALRLNPRLAYVRVTGWGQEGPNAMMAGHDLNYIGLSGALSLFGRDGAAPQGVPPLIGDMAGGALFAVIGLLSAVMRARQDGRGQVVDANIVDGSASLYTLLTALGSMGLHGAPYGRNLLDGGRHFYRNYRCADGGYVAVGAIEPVFRKVLLERLGLLDEAIFCSEAPEDDAACTARLGAIFASQPRDHWDRLFAGTDGCVTAILTPQEAAQDSRNSARRVFSEIDGVMQAAPVPRFSCTPGAVSLTAKQASQPAPQALADWGFDADAIAALRASGALTD